jgi:hypothetical protein
MARVLSRTILLVAVAELGCGTGTPRSASAAMVCAQSIADACAGGKPECRWSFYENPTQFECGRTRLARCGPYDVATTFGVDSGTVAYFDASTGALAAVVDETANFGGSRACAAGPSGGFVEPDCSATVFTSSCPAAGPCSMNGDACTDAASCCSGSCVALAPSSSGTCCPATGCP